MRKIGFGLLIGVLAVLVAMPVLAAYFATIDVEETNGTDYDMVAINNTILVSELRDGGYISSDGLDVRIEDGSGNDVPFMLAEDRMLFASDITGGSVNRFTFTTDNTALDNFAIVTGHGGYVTIPDNADIELGNNFELELEGWVDTSLGSFTWGYPQVPYLATSTDTSTTSHDVSLPDGIESEDLLVIIFQTNSHTTTWPPTDWTSLANLAGTRNLCIAYKVADGSEGASLTVTTSVSASSAHQVFKITDYYGVPEIATTGETNSVNPDPPSLNPSAWDSHYTLWIAGCGTGYAATSVSSYSSGYSGGQSIGGNPMVATSRKTSFAALEDPGTYTLSASAQWRAFTIAVRGAEPTTYHVGKLAAFYVYPNSGDLCASFLGSSGAVSVSDTLTTGDYTVNVWADGADLGLDIDGETVGTQNLGGDSVPDEASDWVLDNMPYFNYYKHTVNDVLVLKYQPSDIVSGTTLIDEEFGTYHGTITWGSNPAGITVTTSRLQVEETYTFEEIETDGADIFAPEPAQLTFGLDMDKLHKNPFSPGVEAIAAIGGDLLPEALVWLGSALFILIGAVLVSFLLSREHISYAAGVGLGLTIIFYVMGIFDYWVIIIFAVGLIASIVHERTVTW
jgi:hypothetical protein